ncbi:MAG TPA: sodium:solute symporter [Edaphocola sp.]|nr:sodium:solute symporter [Edaphocola sp.]
MNSALLLTIVLGYFLLLLAIAYFTSRGSNNESFFVGNRSSKWWVVAFGMIGTSLSGMTFISVPGTVGSSGFAYFQVVIGYWLGYFIVAYVLLPVYYKMRLTSIYTYLEKRLGVNAHKTGALFFILSRTVGATLRLYLVIKVLEIFVLGDLDLSFGLVSVVIMALILLYTFKGGVKTIVWTDTLQTTFMLLSLLAGIIYIASKLDLGVGEAWHTLSARHLTHIFTGDPLSGNNFLKQVIGGAFITIGMTGLDQEMMQKNISVTNLKDSQKNMVVMGTMQMIVVFIFLFLGGLLTIYAQRNGISASGDDLFPAIAIKSGLPFALTIIFIIGLISALFPSADGALTALTSSTCIDLLGMQHRKDWSDRKKTRIRLIIHNIFALVFLGFIFFFRSVDKGSLINILLKLAGYTYGPLLGLFAFGLLTKRKASKGWALPASLISIVLTLFLDLVNNPEWYAPRLSFSPGFTRSLMQLSGTLFHGYKIGVELLAINALITFGLMYLGAQRSTKKPWRGIVSDF